MDFNEGMDQLSKLFKGKDWFYDIGTDQFGRYVVYINYSCHETLHDIPDYVADRQVVVHFAGSKLANKDKFVNDAQKHPFMSVQRLPVDNARLPNGTVTSNVPNFGHPVAEPVDIVTEVAGPEEEEKSILHLQKELDRLEKACGSYTLQDIFYEIQDGKNAVTNLSARYPEVRKSMEKLYDQYGFDVIYEELDG